MSKKPTKRATTDDRTFPNRKAALENARRLLNEHQISRSIYDKLERESSKRKNPSS